MLSEWENDDRRTVFLICHHPARETSTTLKNSATLRNTQTPVRHSTLYLRAIADAYPDFNGNPPPTTTSKGSHHIDSSTPISIHKGHLPHRIDIETPEKPASDPNALEKFLANIYNPASKSQVDQEKVELVVEKPVEEKPTEEQLVAKKAPPPKDPIPEESPAPIESDTDEIIDSFSDCYLSDEEPDQENEPPAEKPAFEADDDYDILDDLLSDSDPTTADQVPQQQSESPAESSAKSESLTDSKSSTEPVVELTLKEQPIPEPDTELEVDWDPEPKEGTRAHWAFSMQRTDGIVSTGQVQDQVFNDLYNTGKDLWAKHKTCRRLRSGNTRV
ncbi:uncharacterized protein OCT59_006213 [Rhizophagus irregularis]|uniref:uncharacterized protein n=1 Tax=Rhizophagus irregularis TaxID=588596 RepID=UPI003330E95F|nr:hypothetical protein OCT59_006213 [Rhizophagus irregularis]